MTLLSRAACCVLRESHSQHAARSTQHESRHLLFLAYGNTLRRDDGAGVALAEKVQPLMQDQGVQITLITLHQLTPEVAFDLADPTLAGVYFFDTAAAAQTPELQVQPICADEGAPVLGHHLTPSALLLYVKALFGVCPPAWLVTIPGYDFTLGEGFSPATAQHLAEVTPLVRKLLQQPTQVDR